MTKPCFRMFNGFVIKNGVFIIPNFGIKNEDLLLFKIKTLFNENTKRTKIKKSF